MSFGEFTSTPCRDLFMSDNLRRYRAVRKALDQVYPQPPSGNAARRLNTLAASNAAQANVLADDGVQQTFNQAEIPGEFALQGNYPNPFNPETTIRFGMPESGAVRLEVYDVLGRRVALLVDRRLAAGWHEATFEAAGLPSGVYLYQLEAAGRVLTRTMLLMK